MIGIDFDNTIVCYDRLFHRLALEQGLIDQHTPANKTAVRDALRLAGREADWTRMQGVAYGPRLNEARPFPGVMAFLLACRRRAIPVRIISHKTAVPISGPAFDLHRAALRWLESRGFLRSELTGLRRQDVFFEPTKHAKLQRIAFTGCETFIDDLPEFLAEPAFPRSVRRVLFDPTGQAAAPPGTVSVQSWDQLIAFLPALAQHDALPQVSV
jgi:hypothetical protein